MRVVLLSLSFLVFISFATQTSAQGVERKNFNITTVKKAGSTKYFARKPWTGLFAAKKFSRADKSELQDIQKTLQASILDLPTRHTAALKKLEVRKENNASRGLANSRMIILNTESINSKEELQAVFTHEMGHVVDLGLLKSYSGTKSVFWTPGTQVYDKDPSLNFYKISWVDYKTKNSSATRSDFISGYAQSSPFEDFAESYLFYRLHGEKFRQITENSTALLAKYNFIKTKVFNQKEFQVQKVNKGFLHNLIWDATLVKF